MKNQMNTVTDNHYTRTLIRLHDTDNVLIAKAQLSLGQQIGIDGATVRLRAQVPAGHKVAACAIAQGEPVRKYDTIIGFASRDIEAGEHVHSHNIELREYERDPGFGLDVRPVAYVPEAERATFMGIVRPDGQVGTRNFIGIFSSVNGSRRSAWLTIPTSTAWWPLPRPAAAACRRPATISTCCAGPSPAMCAIPTWPAR
jgi:altronate hydrolase